MHQLKAPLLPVVIALAGGIAVSRGFTDVTPWLLVLAAAVAAAMLLVRRPLLLWTAVCTASAAVGVIIGQKAWQSVSVQWPQEEQDIKAVVASTPKRSDKWITADVLTADGHHKLRITVPRNLRSESLSVGSGILLHTAVDSIRQWRNGNFDYRRYMQTQGFSGQAFAGDRQWQPARVSADGLSAVAIAGIRALQLRETLLEEYRQWPLDSAELGILSAMTLGDRSLLSRQQRDMFASAGVSHLLALSGMHLSVIYGVVALFLCWGRWRMLSQALVLLVVWTFALVSGLSASIVRATVMLTIYSVLSVGRREHMPIAVLSLAALAMLLVSPLSLFDVGFQLSFVSIAGIVLLTPLLQAFFPPGFLQRHRLAGTLCGVVAVSLAAQIATTPLTVFYFGRLPVWFLLGNVIAIPMTYAVLLMAMAALATSWMPTVQMVFVKATETVLTAMNASLSWISRLPMACVTDISINAVQAALLYIIIICGATILHVATKKHSAEAL